VRASRLTTPDAYAVHKLIIEWDSPFSEDRIPNQAVGLDPVALRLMRWTIRRSLRRPERPYSPPPSSVSERFFLRSLNYTLYRSSGH
jgi:hypothetical protein